MLILQLLVRFKQSICSYKVIDRASSDFKAKMKELLHILHKKPELNKQLNPQSKYEIKTLIIQAYLQHRQ